MVYKYKFTIRENGLHFIDEPKMSYAHTLDKKLFIRGLNSWLKGLGYAKNENVGSTKG